MRFPSKPRFVCFGLFVLLAVSMASLVSAETTTAPSHKILSEDELISAEHNGQKADWDLDVEDSAARQAAPSLAADACAGSSTRNIRYASSTNRIYLEGCDEVFTLTQIAADPDVSDSQLELVDAGNKVWLLKASIFLEEGTTLNVIGGSNGDTEWLRMLSNSSTGVWIKTENGDLYFKDTKVTSWDDAIGDVDTDISLPGGRAHIGTRSYWVNGRATNPPTSCDVNGGTQEYYEARMDIINSEMSHLGYPAGESYGTNWKVYSPNSPYPTDSRELYDNVDVFGDVTDSELHHNYFGTFTFGGYCMNFVDNNYFENISYGLDPHDDSDYLTVTGNTFEDNGNHGFICSKYCDHLTITNNVSQRNAGNGFMLHRSVEDSVLDNNTAKDNTDSGFAIFDSNRNTLTNNTSSNNALSAIRFSVGSFQNDVIGNTFIGRNENESGSGYVLYFYKGSDTPTAGDGLPKNNLLQNNIVTGYKSTVVRMTEATDNDFIDLNISALGSSEATIFDMRPSYGNRVIRPIFTVNNLKAHYRNAQEDNSQPDSIVYAEDQPFGQPIVLRHGADANTILRDSRHYVWWSDDTTLTTESNSGNTMLTVGFDDVGEYETVKTLDFVVYPPNGTVSVTPLTWNTSSPFNKQWTESSNDASGAVLHEVGDLSADSCYEIYVNGSRYVSAQTNGSGRLSFVYSGGYSSTKTFEITNGGTCSPTAISLAQADVSAENPNTPTLLAFIAITVCCTVGAAIRKNATPVSD